MAMGPADIIGMVMPILGNDQANVATFCERLAPQLKMELAELPSADDSSVPLTTASPVPREWKVNLLGGLGPALFGGAASTMIGVSPVGKSTPAEEDRLHDSCKRTKKGAICEIRGPAHLSLGTKYGDAAVDAAPGENATVEIRLATISCRDAIAAAIPRR